MTATKLETPANKVAHGAVVGGGKPAGAVKSTARRKGSPRRRVIAIVPARNEQDVIAQMLDSLLAQTRVPDRIVVVADNCTDDTVEIVTSQFVSRHPKVVRVVRTRDNVHKKAGALNQVLARVLPQLTDDDAVLITDADSILVPNFVEEAVRTLAADPGVGAVCATYQGHSRSGMIHLLQRNEFERFARSVRRRRDRASVLTGVATLFEAKVLREVASARATGRLPGTPHQVYDTHAATEDIEMTHAVLTLGYRPLAPRACVAYTDTMGSWRALYHQRIRWQRGMLDSLRAYGLRRATAGDAARVAGMYAGSMGLPIYIAALVATMLSVGGFEVDTRWFWVLGIFAVERIVTVRSLGFRSRIVAVTLVSEFAYEAWRSYVYWRALMQSLCNKRREWVPT